MPARVRSRDAGAGAGSGDRGGNAISTVALLCRGVNRTDLSPTANFDLAYAVLQSVTNNPFFTDKSTLGNDISVDEGSNTFSFSLTVQLKHPFKL